MKASSRNSKRGATKARTAKRAKPRSKAAPPATQPIAVDRDYQGTLLSLVIGLTKPGQTPPKGTLEDWREIACRSIDGMNARAYWEASRRVTAADRGWRWIQVHPCGSILVHAPRSVAKDGKARRALGREIAKRLAGLPLFDEDAKPDAAVLDATDASSAPIDHPFGYSGEASAAYARLWERAVKRAMEVRRTAKSAKRKRS